MLANILGKNLKKKLNSLKERPLVISILIGNDPASVLYTQMKQKMAEEFNIDFLPIKFPVNSSFENVAKKIRSLNETDEVKGIMIQLPIPREFLGENSKWDLIKLIDPKKDIDGMNPESSFLSATVKGVLKIMEYLKIDYKNLVFGVVGSEGEVGKPLVEELSMKNAKKILRLDKKNPECNFQDLKKADVIISCTGVQGLIDADMVKEGVIAVDVGLGDFDLEVYKKAKMYTPKFGGVGPLTIVSLMENILEASLSSRT